MLNFTDETLRNGPQSLWATRMDTRTMLEACSFLDRTGAARATVLSGASFETAVRFVKDDPWERLRLVRSHLPRTATEVLVRSRNLFGWSRYPDEVVELLLQCLKRNGTDSIKVFDGLNDIDTIAAHCRIARQLGLRVAGMLTFSISPIHTDAHYASKAAQFVALGVDAIVIVDASGILTGPRTESLLAAIKAVVGDTAAIEFYAHATMGLAHESYRAALRLGVQGVTTASEPLANGESLPSTLDVARIAVDLGLPLALDTGAAQRLDDYMSWATFREGRAPGAVAAFDPRAYQRFIEHQIPGGMISNFRQQLCEAGLGDRIDEVLREAGRVRAELGYPIMVTPFSQFVGVQATFNVLQGERYKTVPEEVRLYALGYYGDSGASIDPDVLDRILKGKSQDRLLPQAVYDERVLAGFRAEHGPFSSDEELLLCLFYGKTAVRALQQDKNTFADRVTIHSPLRVLVAQLCKQTTLKSVHVQWKGEDGDPPLRLSLSYQQPAGPCMAAHGASHQ